MRDRNTGENQDGLGCLLDGLLGVKADYLSDDARPRERVRGLLVPGRLGDEQRGVLALLRTGR
jgi:hypothetical protein